MEPYYAMLDYRIFLSPSFLELSMEAQSRFVQLLGTSDRMGVANHYQVWNEGRIKTELMDALYKADLIWPVDAYYCFIPSIYNANRKIRNGKYRSNFDKKGFQICVNKYPELIQTMTDTEREFFRQNGIITATGYSILQANESVPGLECRTILDVDSAKNDSSESVFFEGVNLMRKDYAKFQCIKLLYKDFEEKNNVSILSDQDIANWFMNLYNNNYCLNGVPINDLNSLFKSYCATVMRNKMIQGSLSIKGRNI